jgi:hypothetical protein
LCGFFRTSEGSPPDKKRRAPCAPLPEGVPRNIIDGGSTTGKASPRGCREGVVYSDTYTAAVKPLGIHILAPPHVDSRLQEIQIETELDYLRRATLYLEG